MRKIIFPLMFVCIIAACKQHEKADRIFYHAKIWTGDSTNPRATAIAIKDSMIIYVGNDYRDFQSESTEMTDLGDKMVVPGFIDNHTHFLGGGFQLQNVNLREVKSRTTFIDSIRHYVASINDGRWILGGDWDHEAWGGQMPDRNGLTASVATIPFCKPLRWPYGPGQFKST
jgi:predicted amidohydrolase YtcJ